MHLNIAYSWCDNCNTQLPHVQFTLFLYRCPYSGLIKTLLASPLLLWCDHRASSYPPHYKSDLFLRPCTLSLAQEAFWFFYCSQRIGLWLCRLRCCVVSQTSLPALLLSIFPPHRTISKSPLGFISSSFSQRIGPCLTYIFPCLQNKCDLLPIQTKHLTPSPPSHLGSPTPEQQTLPCFLVLILFSLCNWGQCRLASLKFLYAPMTK